jgi:PAS domain S-box-containing protein
MSEKGRQVEVPVMAGLEIQSLPVAYVEVDAHGVLRRVNAEGCRMIGMPAESLLGHEVWEFLSSGDKAKSRKDFYEALESSKPPPVVRRSVYRAFGAYLTHELHRRVLRDESGAAVGMALVIVDISDAEMAQREAAQTIEWLSSALDAIPQAVVVSDALGFVRTMNQAAERLTGWSSGELKGRQLEEGRRIVSAASRSGSQLDFSATMEEPWNGDIEMETRNGERVAVWLSASPVVSRESGYVNGVVTVLGAPRARKAAAAD